MNKGKSLLLAIALAPPGLGHGMKLQIFPISAVRLLGSPFQEAQQRP
jgi:hypothetical protein